MKIEAEIKLFFRKAMNRHRFSFISLRRRERERLALFFFCQTLPITPSASACRQPRGCGRLDSKDRLCSSPQTVAFVCGSIICVGVTVAASMPPEACFQESMAYIIAEPGMPTKDTACVDACPVDCIHPRKDEAAHAAYTSQGVQQPTPERSLHA
jgi:NAD-dependent dihydropyrimidine dehydrogenase PreA subunit